MGDAPQISVILPTFNESGNIVPLIEAVRSQLSGHALEVLVVDDNSPDGTADVVRSRFHDDPGVRVVVRDTDPSLARSIRRGLEEAKGENVVVMDTDFNHNPAYLPQMVAGLAHYDCVMGSRFLYGGLMNSRPRHLLSWLFNVFVRLVTHGQITDNLYGLFAAKRAVLERYEYSRIFFGFGEYFIRLLYFMQRDGVRILQFPAVNGDRRSGEGNSSFLRTFRQYFAATLRFAAKERLGI